MLDLNFASSETTEWSFISFLLKRYYSLRELWIYSVLEPCDVSPGKRGSDKPEPAQTQFQ